MLRLTISPATSERVAKCLQQSGGGGVVFLNLFKNLLRRLLRIDLCGCGAKAF